MYFSPHIKHGCVSLNSKNTIRELLSEICMHNALHFHEIFYLYIENDVALHVLEYVCIILLCIGLIKPNHFDNPYRYYQLLASCDNRVLIFVN